MTKFIRSPTTPSRPLANSRRSRCEQIQGLPADHG